MQTLGIVALTALAMLAFAANSLLCRLALANGHIDPASFNAIRLVSGAAVLCLIVTLRSKQPAGVGNWLSALALFVYAAGFSFAYIGLTASTGALLLFGAVQVTMIAVGLHRGERFRVAQTVGFLGAIVGLVLLLLPGLSAPPLSSSLMMLVAGLAWGIYSLRAKGAGDPTRVTAGNFLRAAPIAAVTYLLMVEQAHLDRTGVLCALASGALASGVGYAIWYAALRHLQATTAAALQLSVPIIASLGGMIFLSERFSSTLFIASVLTLGGMALVIFGRSARS
jgi:drug/metabolite transporter (DMT)-like permease